jgi:hypothetical protein
VMSNLRSMKNVYAMPTLLKFLVMMGYCAPVFVLGSIRGVRVSEAFISGSRWWSSGGGLVLLIAVVAMFAAACGASRRSKWAVPLYIAGSTGLVLAGLIAMHLAQMPIAEHWYVVVGQFSFADVAALYLCISRGVRRYFYGEKNA